MIENFKEHKPVISESAYVHSTSVIIGKVKLGENVSVWPLAVIRADFDEEIIIGNNTNVQDLAVLHINEGAPVHIGENVTIGHSAVIHGAKIGNRCLIGMKALVMEAEIGDDCLIAGGSIIPPGKKIPPRSLVMGTPGKIIRELTDNELKNLITANKHYTDVLKHYKKD